MVSTANSLVALISDNYGSLGGGGATPAQICNLLDKRTTPPFHSNVESIIVWLPVVVTRIAENMSYAHLRHELEIRVATPESDDRLKTIIDEVRRVVNTYAISYINVQKIGKEEDVSDRRAPQYKKQLKVTLEQNMFPSRIAWSASSLDENAIHVNEAAEINSIAEKGTPVDADILVIEDSAASWIKKKVQLSNLPGGNGGGPGSGTQWTIPVWDTTTTLGDSMISQDSGGTAATIGGTTTISTISAGVADYNKFLVSDTGLIKFRTGAEAYADMDGYVDADAEAVITAEIVDGQSIDNAIDALISTHNVAGAHILWEDSTAGTIHTDNYIEYTDAAVESVITAELVDGQSIDNAIDSLISTHDAITDAHHAVYLDSDAVTAVETADPLELDGYVTLTKFPTAPAADIVSLGEDGSKLGINTANGLLTVGGLATYCEFIASTWSKFYFSHPVYLGSAGSELHSWSTQDLILARGATTKLTLGDTLTTMVNPIKLSSNEIQDSGGTSVFTFDGTGGVTKIGDDSPTTDDFLQWNGSKAIWTAGGTTDGDAIHDNVDNEIQVITPKGTPVGADVVLIEDSAASWAKKSVLISNLPAGSPSFGVPSGDIDIGDAAVEGTSGDSTRADHQHAFTAPGAGYPLDVAASEVDGTATTPARSDHVHAHGSGYSADAHHVAFVGSDFTTAFAAESLANLTTRTHASLSDAPTDAHHNEIHVLATTGPHTDTLPVTDIANGTQYQILKSGASNPAWADEVFTKGGNVMAPAIGYYHIWVAPFDCTVTALRGIQKGGTSTVVNARIDATDQVATADLTLTAADTPYETSTLTSTTVVTGDHIEIEVVTVGSATQILIQLDVTRP